LPEDGLEEYYGQKQADGVNPETQESDDEDFKIEEL